MKAFQREVRMTAKARHNNSTTRQRLDSRIVQQLHTSFQSQWKSPIMPISGKAESSTYKTHAQRAHTKQHITKTK